MGTEGLPVLVQRQLVRDCLTPSPPFLSVALELALSPGRVGRWAGPRDSRGGDGRAHRVCFPVEAAAGVGQMVCFRALSVFSSQRS